MNVSDARDDSARERVLSYAFDAPALAVTGAPGTGKTTLLVARAVAAAAGGRPALLTSASDRAVARLQALAAQPAGGPARLRCAPLSVVAFEVVAAERARTGGPPPTAIDDVAASHVFEGVGAGLFALEWTELLNAEIDPEVTGLRAPERFAAAAYRLIRKLRANSMSPDDFLSACLRGATRFYANPPNFADAALIEATGEKYRDALRATLPELEQQRRRELDLVKVLHRLYRGYLETLVAHGCLTPLDALCEATAILRARPNDAASLARALGPVAVDDAQDLVDAQVAFLRAFAGDDLRGVTFAGDRDQATRAFATGGLPRTLLAAKANVRLDVPHRGDGRFVPALRRVLPEVEAALVRKPEGLDLYRGSTQHDEAHYVAVEVAKALAQGTPAGNVAVVTRNLRCVHPYLEALLGRGVPVDLCGDASLYAFGPVQDALAALWSLVDPYRHDRLLRSLEAPWLALSDASLAVLCGDPPDAQAPLFELPDDDDDETRARWDRKRDVRLGHNVVRGDADAALSVEARERLGAFRAARARWEALERTLDPGALARAVLADTVLASAGDDARGRFARGLVTRLLRELDRFCERAPLGTLEDFLTYADAVAAADADLVTLDGVDADAVALVDVEAAKGREFAHVFVVDVRAGAFPRYYEPDAFVFAPRFGMVAKENVGDDARAARTAKFTYVSYEMRFRQRYNDEERRALYCAGARAVERLSISAWGRATRGKQAPELLSELTERLLA